MKVVKLPDELNLEPNQAVQVYDYCSSKEKSKQQIILNQNIFSFVDSRDMCNKVERE